VKYWYIAVAFDAAFAKLLWLFVVIIQPIVKFSLSLAAIISVSVALSQTQAHTSRPKMELISCLFNSELLGQYQSILIDDDDRYK